MTTAHYLDKVLKSYNPSKDEHRKAAFENEREKIKTILKEEFGKNMYDLEDIGSWSKGAALASRQDI